MDEGAWETSTGALIQGVSSAEKEGLINPMRQATVISRST